MYIFYELMFALSLSLSMLYVLVWNKHYDINISAIFIVIPIANLGYLVTSLSNSVDEVIISYKIVYLGGCFLTFFITMSVWALCDLKVNRYIRFALFFVNAFSVPVISFQPVFLFPFSKQVSYAPSAHRGISLFYTM